MRNQNGDLWQKLYELLGDRDLRFHLVRSHKQEEIGRSMHAWEFVVNCYADGVANVAAAEAQYGEAALEQIRAVDQKTEAVLD